MSNQKTNRVEVKSPPAVEGAKVAVKVPYKFIRIGMIALFLFGILLYANTINHDYVLDDAAAITKNKIVQRGVDGIPELLKTGFYYGYFGYNNNLYRPLPLVTFAIGHSLWGNDRQYEHLINVLLFAFAGVLVFSILYSLLGNAFWLMALLISALFVAHPVHTEVVANIKSRDELLAFIFSMFSLIVSVRFVLTKKIKFIVYAAVSYFLAMLSKESSIAFMLIIPLCMYLIALPNQTESKNTIKINWQKIIVGIMAVGVVMTYLIIRYMLFHNDKETTIQVMSLDNVMSNLGFFERLPTAIFVLGRYLWILFFPHPLVYDYSFKELTVVKWGDLGFIISSLVYLALLAYGVLQARKKKLLGFGILFYLISIFIVSNIALTIGSGMAERFLFTPSLGFCIAFGIVLFKLTKASANDFRDPKFLRLVLPVSLVILCLYGFKTITRNTDWRNQLTLFSNDVKYAPMSARIHFSLGNELLEQGKLLQDKKIQGEMYDKAEVELKKTLNIFPKYAEAIVSLANLYQEKGDFEKANEYMSMVSSTSLGGGGAAAEQLSYNKANALLGMKDYRGAINYYQQAIATNPKSVESYINMGIAYKEMNMPDSAIKVINIGIQINPKSSEAYLNLGTCYSSLNDFNNAILNFKKAIELNPKFAEAYIDLGDVYNRMNRLDDAEKTFLKGYELNPQIPEASFNLGYFYIKKQDYNNGMSYLIKAANLRPNYLDALINISFCASKLGRYQDVIDYAQKAIAVNPNIPDLYYNIAYGYKQLGNIPKAIEYQRQGDAVKAK